MKEIIDWIDRESARLDLIIEATESGFITPESGGLLARHLSRNDPAPGALRAALEIASREQIT